MKKEPKPIENKYDAIIEERLIQISNNIERYGNKQIFIMEKMLEELREITKNTFKGH
jgi:hypothetical protein